VQILTSERGTGADRLGPYGLGRLGGRVHRCRSARRAELRDLLAIGPVAASACGKSQLTGASRWDRAPGCAPGLLGTPRLRGPGPPGDDPLRGFWPSLDAPKLDHPVAPVGRGFAPGGARPPEPCGASGGSTVSGRAWSTSARIHGFRTARTYPARVRGSLLALAPTRCGAPAATPGRSRAPVRCGFTSAQRGLVRTFAPASLPAKWPAGPSAAYKLSTCTALGSTWPSG
jgi:hypothetical protein